MASSFASFVDTFLKEEYEDSPTLASSLGLTEYDERLDDTSEHLRELLNDQQARRDWIVEHWPHIIEYHEVNRSLAVAEQEPVTLHEIWSPSGIAD